MSETSPLPLHLLADLFVLSIFAALSYAPKAPHVKFTPSYSFVCVLPEEPPAEIAEAAAQAKTLPEAAIGEGMKKKSILKVKNVDLKTIADHKSRREHVLYTSVLKADIKVRRKLMRRDTYEIVKDHEPKGM